MTTQAMASAESTKEVKTRTTMSITKSGLQGLDLLAAMFNISRSEFCDRIGKGEIQVLIPSSVPLLALDQPQKASSEAA